MKRIEVDSSVGGYGDIWMRLIGFYAMAEIEKETRFSLLIPEFLRPLAKIVFGDRLEFTDTKLKTMRLEYSNLGIFHKIPGILKGKKYIYTFQKANFNDKKRKKLKDYINYYLFYCLDYFHIVNVPSAAMALKYHGYMDTAGISSLRHISFETFSEQVKKDFDVLHERLNGEIPLSPELTIPKELNGQIVFFANGTSRQFVPLHWAKKYFPDAYYAFFHKERELSEFREAGLKVIPYYKEPGDLIAIAKQAKKVLCTDSFPSHLLQTAIKDCNVAITEVIPERVISPSFKGKVIDSEVTCHPCIHMNRSVPCAAGYFECLNWQNLTYIKNIQEALN